MSAKTNNFTVDSLEEQVKSLREGCEAALAFDIEEYEKKYGDIDFGKLFPCKHLQGLARGASSDETPYFFFTRSGCHNCFCPGEKDSPGELWIVRMGSRNKDGERLGSNHDVKKGKKLREKTGPPPDSDCLSTIVSFDGKTKDYLGNAWPGWMHPGGAQLIDNVLAFPVGGPYNGTGEVEGGIMLIDLEQPEKPAYIKSIYKFGEMPVGGGAVGVTKISNDGYLFVVIASGPNSDQVLRFGLSNKSDLRDSNLLIDFCCDYELKPEDKFGQSYNFAWDTDGTLYLITFINPWPIPAAASNAGKNEVWLYKVNPDALKNIQVDLIVNNKKLPGEPSTYGDANAASGVYISPSGKLILYIGAHCDSSSFAGMQIKRNGFVNMGEFASVPHNEKK